MGCFRYSQMWSNIGYCLLARFVLDPRPLLFIALFNLIVPLVFGFLLAFVVVHSADVYGLVRACLQALPFVFLPLVVARRWVERSAQTDTVPSEPGLSPLFQRPPPLFSR
jgi:hypothetical protein